MELNALQIRRCEGVPAKCTVEQLIAHAVVLLPSFYLELNANEKHGCGSHHGVNHHIPPIVSGMFYNVNVEVPVLLERQFKMTFVVVLQVNLSTGASNNGEVSALLIYYFLTRFVKRRFIVCRKFSKLRQVTLLDLVPALDELRLLEESRHVLGMLFVVELGSGPVICGQTEVSGHEL